jgi:hypothetical protein
MRSRTFFAGTATLIAAALAAVALAKAAPQAAAQNPLLVSDKGAFRILLDGAEVGTEQFETAPSDKVWIVRSETVVRVPGERETRSSGELRISADGTLLGYKWTAQAEKKTSGSVEFSQGTAKTSIDVGAKEPYLQDFVFPSPRVAVLDNNLYSQYALLALLYNWNVKGQQIFPVLIPQDMTPGSVSVESLGAKTIEAAPFEALRVNTADAEITIYFDARRRLMRLEVPAANVAIVRR